MDERATPHSFLTNQIKLRQQKKNSSTLLFFSNIKEDKLDNTNEIEIINQLIDKSENINHKIDLVNLKLKIERKLSINKKNELEILNLRKDLKYFKKKIKYLELKIQNIQDFEKNSLKIKENEKEIFFSFSVSKKSILIFYFWNYLGLDF